MGHTAARQTGRRLAMTARPDVHVVSDAQALARLAAQFVARAAAEAVAQRGSCSIVLAGGATPKALYSLFGSDAALRAQIPWRRLFFFWGDERMVPPTHADSNYRMASDAFLSALQIPHDHIFRIQGELVHASAAAARYEDTIDFFFGLEAGEFPPFDLVLLGMGADGHTASLFPGTKVLRTARNIVAPTWVPSLSAWRVTLTAPALNAARRVLFLVQGRDKAPALKTALEGPSSDSPLPVQLVAPRGRVQWIVDSAAARLLDAATIAGTHP